MSAFAAAATTTASGIHEPSHKRWSEWAYSASPDPLAGGLPQWRI